MGLMVIPPPVPPRNATEAAADAEFYRREAARPRRLRSDDTWLVAVVFWAAAILGAR